MFKLITNQEFGVTDANQEDAEFQFIPLGAVVEAVVMRLSTDLPRVKVRSVIDVGRGTDNGSLLIAGEERGD